MASTKGLLLAAAGIFAVGAVALAQSYGVPRGPGFGIGPGMMGPGMMGPGMMGGYGYRHGCMMRGYGMGPGMMWGGGPRRWANMNRQLSVDDVKRNIERWLAFQGADRLKSGEIVQKDDNTIEATIVTKKENAVVQKFSVDRRSGSLRPIGG